MRRLPVFFVLDCSESMVGDNLKKMEEGLQSIVRTLRSDPYALETVHISIIVFAGVAKTLTPLVELVTFYPPRLPLGGGTSLGAALDVLMNQIDNSVVKTTHEAKGDWKPLVYLFTDGRPTDKPDSAVKRWVSQYARQAMLVAIGLGKNADFTVLKQLTENVIVFEDSKEGDFKKFINWISASVVSQSKSLGDSGKNDDLPILDETVMKIVKEPPRLPDEPSVTFVGRCHKTIKPYLIKFDRESEFVSTGFLKLDISKYHLTGCYPLDEDYFTWTDPKVSDLQVNTSSLVGNPGCPHCGNLTAFAVCGCGKLMCLNGPGTVTCPWCKKSVSFGSGSSDGFNVGRGRG